MFTISQIKQHLIGLSHGGTLNKVRNIESLFERTASTFLLKIHPLESMRLGTLSNLIHDDVYNYSLPNDFGVLIDLIPQDNRTSWDNSFRDNAGKFDLEKAINNKVVSIEGSEGSKIIRINWKSRQGKVLNTLNSLTSNGTWSEVTGASSPVLDTIFKVSGSGSIKFNITSSGGGIKNTSMTQVNLEDEDEVANIFVLVYLESVTNLTSISCRFGNDLTTNYWTPTAQTTQADGTALKTGWNLIKFSWSGATETGTVDPETIDSFQITFTTTGTLSNVRVDNIVFSIGRNFDIKYYSKYLFKNSSGTWISQPTTDDDYIVLDNDTLPIFLMECLENIAHQTEGSDSVFDIQFAENKLKTLYPTYKGRFPSQAKKLTGRYSSSPSRGRW